MEVLTLNGRTYVKASKAARDLGYTSDYVGQLCRGGTVDAHLVGRTWYVNPDTLGAHRVEKKRNARVKAREHAKKTIEETRTLSVGKSTKTYKNIDIRYEKDTKNLIPEVKKVKIQSHVEKVEKTPEDVGPAYTILNQDKKVILKGYLTVEDAEAEEEFTDTVTLSPRVIRSKSTKISPITKKAPLLSFEEKIKQEVSEPVLLEATEKTTEEEAPQFEEVSAETPQKPIGFILALILIVFTGALSLLPAHKFVYTGDTLVSQYFADPHAVLNLTNKNIGISDKLDELSRKIQTF
jgi:hypothetical protein